MTTQRWLLIVINGGIENGETLIKEKTDIESLFDEGLTLETSAFKLFTVSNSRYQLN